MMKRVVLCIFLIVLVVVMTGCFYIDEEMQAIVKSGSFADCSSLDETGNEDRIEECQSKIGIRESDPQMCKQVNDERHKSGCYEKVAVKKKDVSLCQYVTAQTNHLDCVADIAVAKKDIDLCEEISNKYVSKERCYLKYIKERGEALDCNTVKLDADYRDDCYYHFGLEENKAEYCKTIAEQTKRDNCLFTVAINTGGNLLCLELETSKKDECIARTALTTGNVQMCYEIERDTFYFNKCIQNSAVFEFDDGLCQNIKDEVDRKSCELQVANAKEQRGY